MASNNGIIGEMRDYKERMVRYPKLQESQAVKTLRESSSTVRGGKIFNSLPMSVRNYGGVGTTLEGFKIILGDYLDKVPDRPHDVSTGWLSATVDKVTGTNSNSIIHWRILLNKMNPEYDGN